MLKLSQMKTTGIQKSRSRSSLAMNSDLNFGSGHHGKLYEQGIIIETMSQHSSARLSSGEPQPSKQSTG